MITMADGTRKKIELVTKGDVVQSFDESRRCVSYNMVLERLNKGIKKCIQISQLDGIVLKVTPNHPIMTVERDTRNLIWRMAGELKVGTLVLRSVRERSRKEWKNLIDIHLDGFMAIPIDEIKVYGSVQTYDLCVERNHNFVANDTVVHNCTIAYGAAQVLNQRMMRLSDECQVYYCKCGWYAYRVIINTVSHLTEHDRMVRLIRITVPSVSRLPKCGR